MIVLARSSALTAIGIGDATGDDEVVMLNHPRAGFAGVVVITMFAAGSFDPRLIWDSLETDK